MARIPEAEIERLKGEVSVARLVETSGVALAKRGKLLATNTDPNGPKEERTTFYGQRYRGFLDRAPEVYGKVETILITPAAPKLGLDGTVDMVLMMRAMHGMAAIVHDSHTAVELPL